MSARRLRLPLFAVSAVAVVALAGCGDDGGGDGADPSATTSAPGTSAPDTSEPGTSTPGDTAATDAATVVIQDVAFTNPDVTVTAGGTVTFDNQDTQAHTATGEFDTDTIADGEMATVTFEDTGTFAYICSFHPFMKGTVTVV